VGLLLVGIVFLNVRLLVLDGGIARDAERAAELKRGNATLRLRAARLGSSERIQRVAAERGLVWPAPGRTRYLLPNPSVDARLAASRIVAPAPAKTASAEGPAGAAAPPTGVAGSSASGVPSGGVGAPTASSTGVPTATGAPTATDAPTTTGADTAGAASAPTSASIPTAE
jgi:hypothetical protein